MTNVPPTLVEADTVNQRIALIGVSSNVSSISYNGALYLPVEEYDVNLNETRLIVFKSTDGGVTWTGLDRANSPLINGGAYDVYAYYPHYPQVGGTTIYCGYTVPFPEVGFGRARLIQFDLSTETMGTPSADADTALRSVVGLATLSGGDQVLVVVSTNAGVATIRAYVYSAGVFGSPVIVYASPSTASLGDIGIALDNNDRVFISYSDPAGPISKVAVFEAGAVSSTALVANAFTRTAAGIYIPSIDEVWFPASFDPTSGNNIGLFRGTPSSAPVWSTENPGGVNPDVYALFVPILAIEDDDHIFLAWIAVIDNPTDELQVQYLEQVSLGGWGSTQVIWDTITQPLTPPSPFPHDAELQFQIGFNDNNISMTVALFQDFPVIGGFCGTIYYLSQDLTAAPLTLECPAVSTAQVGVFYDQFLGVSGGTPPYFFEVIP